MIRQAQSPRLISISHQLKFHTTSRCLVYLKLVTDPHFKAPGAFDLSDRTSLWELLGATVPASPPGTLALFLSALTVLLQARAPPPPRALRLCFAPRHIATKLQAASPVTRKFQEPQPAM